MRLLTCIFAVLTFSAAPLAAGEAEYRDALEEILRRGWIGTSDALNGAREKYAAAARMPEAEGRAELALALVEMRHRKFEEAEAVILTGLRANPTQQDLARAYIWLQVFTRKHGGALQSMRSLADRFPAEADADPAREAQWQETARLFGRILGFYRGPNSEFSQADLDRLEEQLLSKLSSPYRDAFTTAQSELAAEYEALGQELARVSEQDAADEAKRVELERAFIARERERITSENATLATAATNTQSVGQQELSSIDGQLQPLQRRYNELSAQAAPYQRRIADLNSRIVSLEATAATTKDAAERDRLLREADRLRYDVRREDGYLRPILVEAQRVQLEGQQLAVQRAQLVASVQAQLNELERQRKALARTSGLLDKSESALNNGSSGTSGRARGLVLQREAFTTYQKFPLEEVRARLLQELADEAFASAP